MKRLCLFVALLMSFPIVAAAQARPARAGDPALPPPPPPAPIAPLPLAPPIAPAPRVVVPSVVEAVPMEDLLIDVRADVDVLSAFAQDRQSDVDGLTAQADAMKERSEELKERVKAQTGEIKERAKEIGRAAADRASQMQDFAFQIKGPGFVIARQGEGAYNGGLSSLDRRQYDRAIAQFDQAVAQKSPHADGALYWKAYAQYKLGKSDEAVATLNELRRSYPQSRYLGDSRVLEADVRKTTGKAQTGDADNDDIKLLAISSLQNSNPDGAVPLLENVLKATNSLQVKKKAIFVLGMNDSPAAHQVLVNYAKGSGNPDLQIEAIRYLAARRNKTTPAELEDIYNSTQDTDVHRAVLDSLVSAGDKTALLRYAGGSAPIEIRQRAIQGLGSGNLISPAELMQLYQKEENKGLRQSMVRAFASMGAVDQITQIIKTEKDPDVRQQAIRSLGNMKTERTGAALIELYAAEQDKAVRRSVISALGTQSNVDGLIAVARKETAPDLKLEIVRRIADLAPQNKAAMDFLMEQIKQP